MKASRGRSRSRSPSRAKGHAKKKSTSSPAPVTAGADVKEKTRSPSPPSPRPSRKRSRTRSVSPVAAPRVSRSTGTNCCGDVDQWWATLPGRLFASRGLILALLYFLVFVPTRVDLRLRGPVNGVNYNTTYPAWTAQLNGSQLVLPRWLHSVAWFLSSPFFEGSLQVGTIILGPLFLFHVFIGIIYNATGWFQGWADAADARMLSMEESSRQHYLAWSTTVPTEVKTRSGLHTNAPASYFVSPTIVFIHRFVYAACGVLAVGWFESEWKAALVSECLVGSNAFGTTRPQIAGSVPPETAGLSWGDFYFVAYLAAVVAAFCLVYVRGTKRAVCFAALFASISITLTARVVLAMLYTLESKVASLSDALVLVVPLPLFVTWLTMHFFVTNRKRSCFYCCGARLPGHNDGLGLRYRVAA